MDLFNKISQFNSSIQKLGDIKLLIKISKLQEQSSKLSEHKQENCITNIQKSRRKKMTVGTALFLALALFIVCMFLFCMTVYIKEYRRDEDTIKKYLEQQEKSQAAAANLLASMPVYLVDAPLPKTKKPATVSDDLIVSGKSKKNIN